MRVGLFGNSHAGMLIQAIDRAPPDGISFDYLVRPGPGPDGLRNDGTKLVVEDPEVLRFLNRVGLAAELDLATCDAVVIAGMTMGVRFVAACMRGYSVSGWPSERTVAAQLDARKRPADFPLMSPEAMMAALLWRFENSVLHRLLTLIREASDIPVFLVAQPHPSVAALEDDGDAIRTLKLIHARGDGPATVAALDQALLRYTSRFQGVHIVPRPEDTIREGFLTDATYMRGSRRLLDSGKHDDGDLLHANAEYGLKQLHRLVGALTAAADP